VDTHCKLCTVFVFFIAVLKALSYVMQYRCFYFAFVPVWKVNACKHLERV